MRDPLWENVYASVAPWKLSSDGPDDPYRGLEFEIRVRLDYDVVGQRIIVSQEELDSYPDVYGLTLDRMVSALDDAIHTNDLNSSKWE